jgi:glycosidase
VDPWLPIAHDYRDRNVARQNGDPASMLSFCRTLIHLRRIEPALHVGEYHTVEVSDSAAGVFAFLRTAAGPDAFLVMLNLSANEHVLDFSQIGERAEIAIATGMKRTGSVDLSAQGEQVGGTDIRAPNSEAI